VKPESIRECPNQPEMYWVINKEEDLRVYGILLCDDSFSVRVVS
jgi:hypothetical protein